MGGVMELWNDFEACTVEGRYRLGKVVRSEGRRVWFETEVDGPRPSPALIILTESMNDDDLLLERLRAAEQVQHPNLVAIKDIGTTTVKETPFVYAVTERTEENLDDVLRERPLSHEETRQLLDGLLGALEAIHGRKLIHGRMEPASVLAAGDLIKLRADCIHPVPSDASFSNLAGEDVRGLGNILFRSLTQRSPQNALDPAIQRLPAPYAQIVQHSLSGLATTNEIGNLIRPVVTPAPTPTRKPPARSDATGKPAVIPAVLPSVPRQENFARDDEFAHDAEFAHDEDENKGKGGLLKGKNAPWILGAFVVLLVLIGYFVYSTFRAPTNAQGNTPRPATAATTAKVPSSASDPRTIVTAEPHAAARKSKAAVAPLAPAASATGTTAWRVIAYTYNRPDQAQHKADQLAEKHPEFQPQVFSPKGNRAPYYVTVGGAMSRQQAYEMRQRAIRAGLAHDTFARNFRQ